MEENKTGVGITRENNGITDKATYVVFHDSVVVEQGEITFIGSDIRFKEICESLATRYTCKVYIENEGGTTVKEKKSSYIYRSLKDQARKEMIRTPLQ